MDIEEKRKRQREASMRYIEKNRDAINQRYREGYGKKRQEMQARARQKYARNREARIESSVKWQKANPEKVVSNQRRRHLYRYYGITVEEYNRLLDSQNGRCAICKSETPYDSNWHIDHDHVTGNIRGILCRPCNHMLGHAKDNKNVLRSAADYLENV